MLRIKTNLRRLYPSVIFCYDLVSVLVHLVWRFVTLLRCLLWYTYRDDSIQGFEVCFTCNCLSGVIFCFCYCLVTVTSLFSYWFNLLPWPCSPCFNPVWDSFKLRTKIIFPIFLPFSLEKIVCEIWHFVDRVKVYRALHVHATQTIWAPNQYPKYVQKGNQVWGS